MGNNLHAQEEFLSYYKNYGTESFKVFVRPDDQLKTILATVYYYKQGQERQKVFSYWLHGYGDETRWRNFWVYRDESLNDREAKRLHYDGTHLTIFTMSSYGRDVLMFAEKQGNEWVEKKPIMVGEPIYQLYSADGIYEIAILSPFQVIYKRKKEEYLYTVFPDQDKIITQTKVKILGNKPIQEAWHPPFEYSISEDEAKYGVDIKKSWEARKKLELALEKNHSPNKK